MHRPPTDGVPALRVKVLCGSGSAVFPIELLALPEPETGPAMPGAKARKALALTLSLLVTRVFANDHDPTVTADHLALVANLFDARVDLHFCCLFAVVVPAGNRGSLLSSYQFYL